MDICVQPFVFHCQRTDGRLSTVSKILYFAVKVDVRLGITVKLCISVFLCKNTSPRLGTTLKFCILL